MSHFLYVLVVALLVAQSSPAATVDAPVDVATRARVIHALLSTLVDRYVFPATAQAMQTTLRDHQQRGDYDALSSSSQLAAALTTDLQTVSHDRHVGVTFGAAAPPQPSGPAPDAGFVEVDHMPGNVGYVRVDAFLAPTVAAEAEAAAMDSLADARALIVDLRWNLGGDPAGVALLASYLFGTQPVHLNDIHWRTATGERVDQFWTHPEAATSHYDGPVAVLTSSATFSAGEEFAYDLQQLQRGTVIGERSGGGANPGEFMPLGDNFGVFVPTGRAVNPTSGTNWEGTGVTPDVATSADEALAAALATFS
jgi:retinol-binding protein 3